MTPVTCLKLDGAVSCARRPRMLEFLGRNGPRSRIGCEATTNTTLDRSPPMFLNSFLRSASNLFRGSSVRKASFKPAIEALEQREMLTVAPSVIDASFFSQAGNEVWYR